ncbi:MAG: beta-ketoacyl-[acyl-carrier-protein] synthase family protein [Polyangiaceae bacterium]
MRDWSRQVVVTGAGVVCNMGDDLGAIGEALRAGNNPSFTEWPPAIEMNAKCQVIGEYTGDCSDDAIGIGKKDSRFVGRAARLAVKASRLAIARAGLDDVSDLGVVVGSGTGDVHTHIHIQSRLEKYHDAKKVGPTTIPKIMASTVSANLANILKCKGPSVTATAACAGGAYNILLAAMMIESGHVDRAIAGGVEGTDVHFHAGFDAMRAYNSDDNATPERASRPYAADRAGFIFGEGGGVVVLESRQSATDRGAEILGALRGWGMSSDGEGEMVAPSRDGACRALKQAFAHAEIDPTQIGYVNTHGTSTPLGDVSEVNAIRDAFGTHQVPYSSTKGYTGHTISGAGAIEAIFTLLMLKGGWLAPSVNADPLDPELADYPPVREPTATTMDHAVSNSFGFGGTNVALVLSKHPRALD